VLITRREVPYFLILAIPRPRHLVLLHPPDAMLSVLATIGLITFGVTAAVAVPQADTGTYGLDPKRTTWLMNQENDVLARAGAILDHSGR